MATSGSAQVKQQRLAQHKVSGPHLAGLTTAGNVRPIDVHAHKVAHVCVTRQRVHALIQGQVPDGEAAVDACRDKFAARHELDVGHCLLESCIGKQHVRAPQLLFCCTHAWILKYIRPACNATCQQLLHKREEKITQEMLGPQQPRNTFLTGAQFAFGVYIYLYICTRLHRPRRLAWSK
jgi:hypothetical protein